MGQGEIVAPAPSDESVFADSCNGIPRFANSIEFRWICRVLCADMAKVLLADFCAREDSTVS